LTFLGAAGEVFSPFSCKTTARIKTTTRDVHDGALCSRGNLRCPEKCNPRWTVWWSPPPFIRLRTCSLLQVLGKLAKGDAPMTPA